LSAKFLNFLPDVLHAGSLFAVASVELANVFG
jgi:hypothetical protein